VFDNLTRVDAGNGVYLAQAPPVKCQPPSRHTRSRPPSILLSRDTTTDARP
jgi:hypothetical protein